jgi:O-antigen ligase
MTSMNRTMRQAAPLYLCILADRYGASSQSLFGLYKAAVLCLVLFLVYLNIPTYVYRFNSSVLPIYFYVGLFFIISPILLLKPIPFISYLFSPFALWAIVLVALNTIHFASTMSEGNLYRAGLINTRIQYILLATVIGFAFSITPAKSYEKIIPYLAVLIPCTVALDFFFPGYLHPRGSDLTIVGRGSAAYFNPNIAGEVILIVFLLASPVVRTRWRTILFILAGIGVALTFARAAIVAWIILLLYLSARRVLPKSFILFTVLAVGCMILIGGFESYLNNRHDFDGAVDNIQARLQFFSGVNLNDDSAHERMAVLRESWNLFLENPLFGAGAGITETGPSHQWHQRASTHNQLLLLAAEYGIFGIILWATLLIALWKGRYFKDRCLQHAVVLLVLFMTMFTHNMFEYLHWLVTFAMVSAKRRV